MRNSNLFIFTRTTYECNPPSCGGNWDPGEEVTVAMSRSPKLACAMNPRRRSNRGEYKGPECSVTTRHYGAQGVPTMNHFVLKRGNKVIWDYWD